LRDCREGSKPLGLGEPRKETSALRVVFHLGVHFTDEDRLVRSLLKNRDVLGRQGVFVPGPGRYRKVLRDVVNRLRGDRASGEAQDLLLEAIANTDPPETLFLSNESFICLPERALDEGRLYARAFKTQWLRHVFPDSATTFAIALRDPATFVPALFRARKNRELDFVDYTTGLDPRALRWSDTLDVIREHNPDAEIVVWCNEDTPLAWGGIMRAVTGIADDTALDGMLDIATQIVTPEGAAIISEHFGRPPYYDGPEFRRALATIIERHASEELLAEVIDLPGWDTHLMDDLTAAYDEDVRMIAAMPGVRFVAP
jgi:hypothetical protein